MEFLKLILVNKNAKKPALKQSQKVWQIKPKIDYILNKITLIIKSSELNVRLKSHQKIL